MKIDSAGNGGPEPEGTVFEFGAFRFDPSTGDLVGPDGSARLPRQAARLLHLLVRREGALVSREEIKGVLWPAGHVEFDQGINFLIRQIRKALGESAEEPIHIETLPRRGYRFRGIRDEDPVESGPRSGIRNPVRRGLLVSLGVVAAIVVLARFVSNPPDGERSVPILAVIPPDLRTGEDRGREAVTVAEVLTASFSSEGEERLRVLGPAATRLLQGEADATVVARRELSACLVISGSIGARPEGGSVVFIQLLRTSDQAHLFARRDSSDHGREADLAGRVAEIIREAHGPVLAEAAMDCPS